MDGAAPRPALVVDDSPLLRRLVGDLLRRAGYAVTEVDDGRVALEAIGAAHRRDEPFALIVLDLRLPEVDGLGVLRALRDAGMTGPVIALSGDDDGRATALAAGATATLPKPFDPQVLLALVAQVDRQG
jgi:DNA-binding response OmpR family regulator